MAITDPYAVLGIPRSAGEAEIRAAYRRQVQRHHPDHNGGSAESARRFEEVQEAYAMIRRLRPGTRATRGGRFEPTASPPPRREPADPGLEQRLAAIDRELRRQREAKLQAAREAQRIREDALRQAREAARPGGGRASDEDLGYVATDDSFSSILDDAAARWSERLSEPRPDRKPEPVTERLADLFDDWGARLRGDKRRDRD